MVLLTGNVCVKDCHRRITKACRMASLISVLEERDVNEEAEFCVLGEKIKNMENDC